MISARWQRLANCSESLKHKAEIAIAYLELVRRVLTGAKLTATYNGNDLKAIARLYLCFFPKLTM
jgi:hypothetical protein